METKRKWKKWHKVTLGIVGGFFLIGIIGVATDSGQEEVKVKSAKKNNDFLFNVPSFINQNANYVKQQLGKPDEEYYPTKEDYKIGDTSAVISYNKKGYTLSVTFYPISKKITEFYIQDSTNIPDYKALIPVANLDDENTNYSIIPTGIDNNYIGIRIVPGKRKSNTELAKRKQKIENQFSVIDGSHKKLEEYVIDHLNDPGSYEHLNTVYWDRDSFITVKMQYTAKNGFGGRVRGVIIANCDNDGNIIKIISSK